MNIDSGVDIVEVSRIKKAVDRWQDNFLRRIFTPLELKYANSKKFSYQHLAARFAAKEALYKALGEEWDEAIKWTEIEIRNNPSGKPFVKLTGKALELKKRLKVVKVIISMSHTRNYAFASAILVKGEPSRESGIGNSEKRNKKNLKTAKAEYVEA